MVAIVTGASSGIGRCTARALRERGCRVFDLSRRHIPQEGVTHIFADVTDENSVNAAVERILAEAGSIDVVVNCAGFGISGAVESISAGQAWRQMDVNFFGMVRMNRAVLPAMREAGRGRIVNISSVAAPVPIPFQSFYSASKAAVNSYTMSLANEVKPFGISVTAVMPGDIASGFTDARDRVDTLDEVYGGRIGRSVARMERDERGGMSPERVGRYIADIALKKRVKPLYTIGFSYKCACLLMKLLPCGLANRIIGCLYAK